MEIYSDFKLGRLIQDPQNWQRALDDYMGGDVGGMAFSRINVAGAGSSAFQVSDSETPIMEFIGVPLAQYPTRRRYRPDAELGTEVPLCHSPDGRTGIGDPGDERAAKGLGCSGCPFSEPGSGRTDMGRACPERRIVPVLLSGNNVPDMLHVAPTSIRAITNLFGNMLKRDIAPGEAVVKFTTKVETINKKPTTLIVAEVIGLVPTEARAAIERIGSDISKARLSIVSPPQPSVTPQLNTAKAASLIESSDEPATDDRAALAAEYERVVGSPPPDFMDVALIKANIEAAGGKNAEPDKPKRRRRTKAQIEADKAAEAKQTAQNETAEARAKVEGKADTATPAATATPMSGNTPTTGGGDLADRYEALYGHRPQGWMTVADVEEGIAKAEAASKATPSKPADGNDDPLADGELEDVPF